MAGCWLQQYMVYGSTAPNGAGGLVFCKKWHGASRRRDGHATLYLVLHMERSERCDN